MQSDNPQEFLPLDKASQLLESRPHPHTLRRWILKGVKNRKLEGKLIRGRWHVTEKTLKSFAPPAK